MTDVRIIVYGADWCPDVVRAKEFMDAQNITYISIDTDLNESGRNRVMEINNGKCIIPTIFFNEKPYVNPDDKQIIQALEKI